VISAVFKCSRCIAKLTVLATMAWTVAGCSDTESSFDPATQIGAIMDQQPNKKQALESGARAWETLANERER
jgi:hypothetical protein